MQLQTEHNFIADVKLILQQARQKAYTAVNFTMVDAYWFIEKRILEEEQQIRETLCPELSWSICLIYQQGKSWWPKFKEKNDFLNSSWKGGE